MLFGSIIVEVLISVPLRQGEIMVRGLGSNYERVWWVCQRFGFQKEIWLVGNSLFVFLLSDSHLEENNFLVITVRNFFVGAMSLVEVMWNVYKLSWNRLSLFSFLFYCSQELFNQSSYQFGVYGVAERNSNGIFLVRLFSRFCCFYRGELFLYSLIFI